MSESEPPVERPPRATRTTPRTVRVRRDDYVPEVLDGPTGPPKVLFWFRLTCVVIAVVALVYVGVLAAVMFGPGWDSKLRAAILFTVMFAAYILPLWWRRPQWWHWIYGLVVMLPLVVPPVTPVGAILMVFWCQRRTIRFFRDPQSNYAPEATLASADATPVTEPPGVLFALRWLCALGCVACLLAVPIAATVHAADPSAGWGVMCWLGGFAVAFGLFVVPLFARTPRRWVWWYGVVLLVLCSLSLYFTLLAVPTLVFWLMKRPREYFASNSLVNPGSHAGGVAPAPPA